MMYHVTPFTLLTCSALEKTQTRVVSFDDSVTSLRETLSDLLEKEEDYSKAAQVCVPKSRSQVLQCFNPHSKLPQLHHSALSLDTNPPHTLPDPKPRCAVAACCPVSVIDSRVQQQVLTRIGCLCTIQL